MAFLPVPDITLPNGGEIHANSYLAEDGRHAVVLHLKLPHSEDQRITLSHIHADLNLPPGFHICFDRDRAFPANRSENIGTRKVEPGEVLSPGTLVYCPRMGSSGIVAAQSMAPSGWIGVHFPQFTSVCVLSPNVLFVV